MDGKANASLNASGEPATTADKHKDLGCEHYRRKCALVAPCCNKIYTCRVCHDDKENHEINRKAVQRIKCLVCDTEQEVQEKCTKCDAIFGNYFCNICRLYDDTDKKQFHCDGCEMCRVGGRENFFHCPKCELCLAVAIKDTHKCVERASKGNCPVCLEAMHSSREGLMVPKCGHVLHSLCHTNLLKSGNYACPICAHSLVDMQTVWEQIDQEIEQTPMPEEYRNYYLQILCRDCNKESRVLFHVIGLKCQQCGSYNTCRAAEPEDAQSESPTAAHDATQDEDEENDDGWETASEESHEGTSDPQEET